GGACVAAAGLLAGCACQPARGGSDSGIDAGAKGVPSPEASSFEAEPPSVPADGTATAALTVTVKDPEGTPLAGLAVEISASGSDNLFAPSPAGVTDAIGQIHLALASTRAEH